MRDPVTVIVDAIVGTKNDRDNANHKDGYDAGRGTRDPATYIADSLVRDTYGKAWNDGFDKGKDDAGKYGKKD